MQVRIIGFPDQNNSHSSAEDLDWEHEGVEVQELRRGRREDLLLRWVPFLKKRRATLPLAIACYEWAYSRQISRLCRGSSVFHYFGTGMEMNGYAIADAAKKIQAKFVIEPAIHAGTWGDTWLDKPLYKKGDLLLAHTDYEAAVIFKLGIPKSKIRTIVHGVDFCESGDGARFLEKHQISGPMVLFLGRKTREKGVWRLVEAWSMVAEKFPEATLVIAGPKSEALRQMADGRWQMADGTTKATTPARQRIAQGEVECVGWEPTGAERSDKHKRGEEVLTTDDTDRHGWEKHRAAPGEPGLALSSQNPSTSKLARDSENTSRTLSASGPASAFCADVAGIGSDGGSQLADSVGFLEGQSQGGLQIDKEKSSAFRNANAPISSGENSSSVLILEIRGSNSEALDTGYSLPATAPKALPQILNLDDLPEGEKQDALAACDVLCVPSEGESFGMVYYEAWAYKKPVVALDLPVLRETIGSPGGGLLCNAEPQSIANALIQLLSNPELAYKLGNIGHAVAQLHDWPKALASYLELYKKANLLD